MPPCAVWSHYTTPPGPSQYIDVAKNSYTISSVISEPFGPQGFGASLTFLGAADFPAGSPSAPEQRPSSVIAGTRSATPYREQNFRPPPDGWGPQLVEKALLQGVPSPEGDGIKLNLVISGGMYLGNDTSHESFADNFARNRDEAFVQSSSKKWLCHFFDSLRPPPDGWGPVVHSENGISRGGS